MMTEQVKKRTEELGYYLAPAIDADLQRGKMKVVKGDQDRVYIVDGREGHGKSSLALQLAHSQDPTLSLDRVVFKPGHFEEIIRKAKKYQAVVFDEAFNGLSSKSAMSKENKRLVRLLQEVRQRNLFIYIVLPSIFLLEKYPAIFRSEALFHVYMDKKGVNHRYYKRYNYTNKKVLYLNGKKGMSYWTPRIRYTHRFYRKFPETIDYDEYTKKKLNAFRDLDKEPTHLSDRESKILEQRTIFSALVKHGVKMNFREQQALCKKCDCEVHDTRLSRKAKDVLQKMRNAGCVI